MENVAIYFFALKFNMNLGLTVFSSKYLKQGSIHIKCFSKVNLKINIRCQ
jgi:hypothetical protein